MKSFNFFRSVSNMQHTFRSVPNMLEKNSESYQKNYLAYKEKESVYVKLKQLALSGGGEKGIARHTQV